MEPAASLDARLLGVTFADLTAEQVTARLIDEIVAWGEGQGWRVYRRAASVLRLPPPMQHQHSVLDVACARPDGAPLAVEVDQSNRTRTVEKLLAEAAAGRLALWLRWGTGPFAAPPAPVRMVTCAVTKRGRLFSRLPARPAPVHRGGVASAPVELPILGD